MEKRKKNPLSHWEWERQGISFDQWKKEKNDQKSKLKSFRAIHGGDHKDHRYL